jgi:hypothetical protein
MMLAKVSGEVKRHPVLDALCLWPRSLRGISGEISVSNLDHYAEGRFDLISGLT